MGYCDEYDEYDEYEECDETVREGRNNTEAKVDGRTLEIKFNMKGFSEGIIEEVRQEVVKSLRAEMLEEIKKEVFAGSIKEKIQLSAHEIVKDMIDDYVAHEKITVGGNSFWDDEPLKEYSMQEYAKKCIADAIKERKFHVVTGYEKDRYSERFQAKTKSFTFEDYIRSELAIGNDIKEYLDEQIREIKDSVNKNVKELFDASTKQMLSESVLNILMANDTYKKIENGIACIADNVQNKEDDEWN